MKSDTLLDCAVFQLSPRHSRYELFVSSDGNSEKLASGVVKPFVTHLKVAEEQIAQAVQSIKLEIERDKSAETWFTKRTLERFVLFVSTPEVLEMVNTFDAEMSQLEGARRIYSQGAGDRHIDSQGGVGTRATAAADETKKELLRAIDVRLAAVREDLTTACARALAAGFNPDTVADLKHFADRFGAHRLNEACSKYMSIFERRGEVMRGWKKAEIVGGNETEVRSSVGSDMSIDDPTEGAHSGPNQPQPMTWQQNKPNANASNNSRRSSSVNDENKKDEVETQPARRLSVQDRINLFENKQKENTGGTKPTLGKPVELRRLSSDVGGTDKSVLRRWSGASDMSIDVSGDRKDAESPLSTPSSSVLPTKSHSHNSESEDISFNADRHPSAKQDSKDKSSSRAITDQGSSHETTKVNHERTAGGGGSKESQYKASTSAVEDVMSDIKLLSTRDHGGMKHHLVVPSFATGSHSHSRSLSGQFESGTGLKFGELPVQVECDPSTLQPQFRSSTGQAEDVVKNESTFLNKQQIKVEGSEFQKMKYQKPQPANRDQISKLHSKKDEVQVPYESSKFNFSGKEPLESQDSARATSSVPLEQLQRVRQCKGNQGFHDELKMKADELEKLFAEHKLRVPGDQSCSVRRTEPADAHVEQAVNSQYRRPAAVDLTTQLPSRNTLPEPTATSSNMTCFDAMSPVNMVNTQNYGDALKRSFSDLNFGDDSRGKFYENYMKKRDAKLREEWGSKRVEKEARMKAMQDSLEQSRAEMKAKFSASVGTYHAEKLRSFKSSIKREQHPIDSLRNEEDDDLYEFSEEKNFGQDSIFSESTFADGASRQSRKTLPNRHVSSATTRTVAGSSISRSSAKSGRRRDSPLAQSVPNFSDLRKENTKPSSGVSKTTTRFQVRNYARSKSTHEEMQGIKEEKPKRTQSLRKSSANPSEFNDLSPLNSDGVVLAPLKFDVEQTGLGPYDQSPRSFLKKGYGLGLGAGGSAIRMRASMASDTQQNEEFDELAFEVEDSLDVATEERDEIETMAIEDRAHPNNGKLRLSQESEKSGNSGSEVGGSTRSLSQLDHTSIAEMPPAMPLSFNGIRSLQASPVESPVSWNSRLHHPFSYPHESSDIDASIDSPIGSPASWNSHSLTHGETDATRMRKKWGNAQKPVLVANSSQNQPRKDVTKGFKRLLKFGRKNRGSESLVDWISATTSEGDDETEDGRDVANRSSEELRKSRMGFSHGHPSDDSFNESELFNEQVQSLQSSIPAPPANFKVRDDHISGSSLKAPRSFFSLSSFRSKGSDAKPR